MAHKLKKREKIIRADVVNLHPAMRVFTDSFIVSNPGQNYTVSDLYVFCEKHTFLYGKMLVTASKRYFGTVVPQVDGEVFPTFGAKRQRI